MEDLASHHSFCNRYSPDLRVGLADLAQGRELLGWLLNQHTQTQFPDQRHRRASSHLHQNRVTEAYRHCPAIPQKPECKLVQWYSLSMPRLLWHVIQE